LSSFIQCSPFQFRTAAISVFPCTGAPGAVFLLDLSSRQLGCHSRGAALLRLTTELATCPDETSAYF
jgi:hypothetical protein